MFQPILAALPAARELLGEHSAVVSVRAGYHYPLSGEPIPAVVVATMPDAEDSVDAAAVAAQIGQPVSVVTVSLDEQLAIFEKSQEPLEFSPGKAQPGSALEALMGDPGFAPEFRMPKTGNYEPMDPPDLPELDEEMEVTICVSPEAGWTPLKGFIQGTKDSLTIAMYQFTAPHIFEAIQAAVTPAGRKLELVLHPIPEPPSKSGIKANDLEEKAEVLRPLDTAMGERFQFAWAALKTREKPDGLWASAYHIKVAVRDSEAIWLSSGNWQSTNQPNIDPFADEDNVPSGFHRKYNRDYHAIVHCKRLAEIFEKYIKRDRELSAAMPGGITEFALPDLFVPIEEEEPIVEFATPPQFFRPLALERRKVRVQPLLTPDNYPEFVLQLIQSAQKSVWFQNQYINFRNDGDDFPEFAELVGALKDQIDAGREVRIICRDLMKQESLDVLIALGFPRDCIRFQKACHNKAIIVDGEVVMFGSQNWSNEGVRPNRDASLLFYDKEIAEYLAGVFDYDWKSRATAKPTASRVRVARPGENPPPGMRRASASEVIED